MKTAVIVNPHSAGGKTGRQWPEIAARLTARLGPVDARLTERPGHATGIARELLGEGYDRIIAAGGDGTINEIANGFLHEGRPLRPAACLGLIPLGTGGDFRRSLGIPNSIPEAIDILAAASARRIDVGQAAFRALSGRTEQRYFVNLLSFGMGGEVASRAKNFLTPLGGAVGFLWATAAALLSYRRKRVRLTLDGGAPPASYSIYNVAAGNGRFHGGGMQACPTARLDDGILEVTVIEYMSQLQVIRDFRVLYSDNVYRHPKVHHLRAHKLLAESDEPVKIEVDGEPLGTLPLEITMLPRCLPVVGSWS